MSKRRSNVAVLPAQGIGDALLMMIASHRLHTQGHAVTTVHDALPQLKPWFPDHDLQKSTDLDRFDLIIVENDNSPKIKQLIERYRERLAIFYPTYSPNKHAPLANSDRVFNPDLPMADNIAEATGSTDKNNGIVPPMNLSHRSKPKQVVIHPTSRVAFKNWRAEGFVKVAHALKEQGYEPVFCVGPDERASWAHVKLPSLSTLSDLAALIYESGFVIGNDSVAGHLASNLNIPTLIIADDEKRMRLWRPGWRQGKLVLPSPYLPNWKFFRKRWQRFVTPDQVLNTFQKLFSSSAP